MIWHLARMKLRFGLILLALAVAQPTLCQNTRQQGPPGGPGVYVCPGLNVSNVLYPSFMSPSVFNPSAGSPYCPCQSNGAKVALGDAYVLLSLMPKSDIDQEDSQCQWQRAGSRQQLSEDHLIAGQIVSSSRLSWLQDLCNIQSTSKWVCFGQVRKALRQQVERWTASLSEIQEPLDDTPMQTMVTKLGEVSLAVTAPCSPTNCSNENEVCDERLHYCRHVCNGPTGGTKHCTSTIGEKATCKPDKTQEHGFKCVCDETRGLVGEHDMNGALVSCKASCQLDEDCPRDEVCSPSPMPNGVIHSGNNQPLFDYEGSGSGSGSGEPEANIKTCNAVCGAQHPCDLTTTKCEPNENRGPTCKCLDDSEYLLDDDSSSITRCTPLLRTTPQNPEVNIGDLKLECSGDGPTPYSPAADLSCEMPQAVKTYEETVLAVILRPAFAEPKLRLLPSEDSSVSQPAWDITVRKDFDSVINGKVAYAYTLELKAKLGSLGKHNQTLLFVLERPSVDDSSSRQELTIAVRLNLSDEIDRVEVIQYIIFAGLVGLFGILVVGNSYIYGFVMTKMTKDEVARQEFENATRRRLPLPPHMESTSPHQVIDDSDYM